MPVFDRTCPVTVAETGGSFFSFCIQAVDLSTSLGKSRQSDPCRRRRCIGGLETKEISRVRKILPSIDPVYRSSGSDKDLITNAGTSSDTTGHNLKTS
jgi:hypothetical protein